MIRKTDYDINKIGSFEKEWLYHRKCQDWWYATGYLDDEGGNRYSFQFTVLSLYAGPHMITCMTALTDFQTGEQHYCQSPTLFTKNLNLTETEISFKDMARAAKTGKGICFHTKEKYFELSLETEYRKGPVWHCDHGRLQMGEEGDRQTTYYYSYTNLPTKGILNYKGKELKVTGKTWFDKQGGTFSLKPEHGWEWFSLRFFDDEEMMLFYFPINRYQDGTFIDAEGTAVRMNGYTLQTTKFIETETPQGKSVFSAGWELNTPGLKEERYTITPILEGAINFAYYEELCAIRNSAGRDVGLCFVELWPFMHNSPDKVNLANLFKKMEF